MADFKKIGLLVLNEDRTKFLVCEPGTQYQGNKVTQYLMPGGHLEEDSDVACLQAEIEEELNCEVDVQSLKLVGDYEDVAASDAEKIVLIRLYAGRIVGKPKPSSEIGALHWIGKNDEDNIKVSAIIRNKIIPDLIRRNVLQ